jgi:hypothetical protein
MGDSGPLPEIDERPETESSRYPSKMDMRTIALMILQAGPVPEGQPSPGTL